MPRLKMLARVPLPLMAARLGVGYVVALIAVNLARAAILVFQFGRD